MILRNQKKDFIYYTTFVSGISVASIFLYRLYSHIKLTRNIDAHLGGDYRICQTGPDGLSRQEIENGAIGIIDFECSIDGWRRMISAGEGYRTGAYYITYTIFALVLTHAKLTGKSNKFITQIMRYLLLFGILSITASRYSTEWILSIFPLSLAANFTIMMSVLASILLVKILTLF